MQGERRHDLVRVEVTNTDLLREGTSVRTRVTFRLTDKDGKVLTKNVDPADLDWIQNLIFYTNWGVKGFLSPRGTPIYVKSDFKDITQKGDETTPKGCAR